VSWFNRVKRTKLVAIKNFDEELYRLVKTYASLEGRTIASIFEEAIRQWISNRKDYDEIRLWVNLEQAYEENFEVLRKSSSLLKDQEGYAVICNKKLVGVFNNYERVLEGVKEICNVYALIIKLPYREPKRIELGLSW